jgi:valyl-tRNA synthetase
VIPGEKGYVPEYKEVVSKLGNVSKFEIRSEEVAGEAMFMVKATAYCIPFVGNVDVVEECAKIKEEIAYNKGFLEAVLKKLSNEKFVASAPAKVVEVERKKQEDAEEKIRILEERLLLLQ